MPSNSFLQWKDTTQLAVSILYINNDRPTGLVSLFYFAGRGPQDWDIMQRRERMCEEIVMLIYTALPPPFLLPGVTVLTLHVVICPWQFQITYTCWLWHTK